MKRAIVNVACGGWYPSGQVRLAGSLDRIGETADRLFFKDWPRRSHTEAPYAFKVDAFEVARQEGYESILWLDSSCIVVKPLPWDEIDRKGYFFGREGWSIGQWCNDSAKQLLEVTEEEMSLPLMEGKIIGLDVTDDRTSEFLALWKHASEIGAFNGSWDGPDPHRHDITCGAILAHRLGMGLTDNPVTLGGPRTTPHPDSYVLAQGLR